MFISWAYISLFDLMQTDPNWSNFLYDDTTKTINLIDFGAARDYPKSFVDDYIRMVNPACITFVYTFLLLGILSLNYDSFLTILYKKFEVTIGVHVGCKQFLKRT